MPACASGCKRPQSLPPAKQRGYPARANLPDCRTCLLAVLPGTPATSSVQLVQSPAMAGPSPTPGVLQVPQGSCQMLPAGGVGCPALSTVPPLAPTSWGLLSCRVSHQRFELVAAGGRAPAAVLHACACCSTAGCDQVRAAGGLLPRHRAAAGGDAERGRPDRQRPVCAGEVALEVGDLRVCKAAERARAWHRVV